MRIVFELISIVLDALFLLWHRKFYLFKNFFLRRKGPSRLRTRKIDSHPRISLSQLAVPFGSKTYFFLSCLSGADA